MDEKNSDELYYKRSPVYNCLKSDTNCLVTMDMNIAKFTGPLAADICNQGNVIMNDVDIYIM